MPRHRLRSEHLNVDPGVVTSFHDKPREHGDAGAVEEIQFSKIQHNRHRGSDQGFLEHIENGRVILRSAQAQRAFEKNGGVLLFCRISKDSP